MAAYLPPGWPTGVHPPGSQDFERTAVAWLLDVVPPDYRLYGVLRRHPVALAALARHHVAACVEGARQGYRTARTELGEVLPVHGLDAVLAAYRSEGSRLVATARAVDLVARALRGEVFTPQLRDPQGADQETSQDGRPEAGPGTSQNGRPGASQDGRPEAGPGTTQGETGGPGQDAPPAPARSGRRGTSRKGGQGPGQNGRQAKPAGQRGRQKAAARGGGR